MKIENAVEEEIVSSPSPVVRIDKAKKMKLGLLVVAAMSFVGFGFATQHWMKIKPKDSVSSELSETPGIFHAPEINKIIQSVAEGKRLDSPSEIKQENTLAQEDDQRIRENADDQLEKMRLVAPTTVYSGSSSEAAYAGNQQASSAGSRNNPGVLGGNGRGDVNAQFMSQVSNSSLPTAFAGHLAHPGFTLAVGTMINATLESELQSDLPGMVNAVTSEDIYSEDGSQVLLPKGSKLVGQYTNAIQQGQSRFFVIWQRAQRPDHITIELNSPGTDPLGTAGIGADTINHHFWEKWGVSSLLTITSAGAANVGVGSNDQFNSAAAYRESLSTGFANASKNSLESTLKIPDTLTKHHGAAISIYVARDLDFYNELMSGRRAW